jgi:hypothetical protein
MKILHLFSDWKWTGPTEPVLNLCKELQNRGHDVTLAYQKAPFPVEDSFEKRILKEGVKSTQQFYLNHGLKFFRPSAICITSVIFRTLPIILIGKSLISSMFISPMIISSEVVLPGGQVLLPSSFGQIINGIP